MEKVTHSLKKQFGTMAPREWFDKFPAQAKFIGDDMVEVTGADGKKEMALAKQCCIVFTDPKIMRGNSKAVEFTPGRTAAYVESSYAQNVSRTLDVHNTCLVPLGGFNKEDDKTYTVLNQTSREWLSACKGNIAGTQETISNMLLSALKTLTYHLTLEKSLAKQTADFKRLVIFAKSVNAFYQHEHHEVCRQTFKALAEMEIPADVLQQVLAVAFTCTNITRKYTIRVLEITLKRATKYGKKNMLDGFTGPLAVLVIAPLLQRALHHNWMAEDCQREFNIICTEIAEHFRKLPETMKTDTDIDVAVLTKLLGFRNMTVEGDGLRKLVTFCRDRDNQFKQPDITGWGLVRAIKPTFPITLIGYQVLGAPSSGCAFVELDEYSESKEISVNSVRVVGRNPTRFCPFALHENGVYQIGNCSVIGIAEIGKGDTRNKELSALWRVTGQGNDGSKANDCLPEFGEGYSTAGKLRRKGWKHDEERWTYADVPALDIMQSSTLEITDTKITVTQNDKVYAVLTRTLGGPVVIGLNGVAITLTKLKKEEVKAVEPKEPETAVAELEALSKLVISQRESTNVLPIVSSPLEFSLY